ADVDRRAKLLAWRFSGVPLACLRAAHAGVRHLDRACDRPFCCRLADVRALLVSCPGALTDRSRGRERAPSERNAHSPLGFPQERTRILPKLDRIRRASCAGAAKMRRTFGVLATAMLAVFPALTATAQLPPMQATPPKSESRPYP